MADKLEWPSVDEQISAAKAPKGSNLEKLIRANQEFNLLHPSEMSDNFSIPLWLRVAWRKQHPDVALPEKNPGAAYPEVLSQAHRRMLANPHERWGPDAANPGPAAPKR